MNRTEKIYSAGVCISTGSFLKSVFFVYSGLAYIFQYTYLYKKLNDMKIISTRAHGVLDYLMGAVLITLPWTLGFAKGGAETLVPVILGAGTILFSLFTDYELGIVKSISMPGHLMLDMLSGMFLAASPWLFNFDWYVFAPFVWIGLAEVVVVMLSDKTPYKKMQHRSRGKFYPGMQN